jgi:hypothetical protein
VLFAVLVAVVSIEEDATAVAAGIELFQHRCCGDDGNLKR